MICYLRDLSFNNDHVLSKEFCEITNFAEFFFFFFFEILNLHIVLPRMKLELCAAVNSPVTK